METLPKILESKTQIRFQHCDPYNHLNNSNYIDYFMNHREDVLTENYDLDIYKMAKETGKAWVSSSNQIVYLKPAYLMEEVTIQSQLFYYTDSELFAEMRMYNKDKTQLKSLLWASFVHVNIQKQKRETHSADLMKIFSEIILPVNSKSFDERVQQIRSNKYEKTLS